MKVIHLFYDFQFLHSKVLIWDMNKWHNELFGKNETEFWIIGVKDGGDAKYYDLGDISQFKFFNTPQKAVSTFFKYILKKNILIIHGGNYNLWLPLFFLPSFVLRKIKWICWGSQINKGSSDIKSLIYYKVRRHVFRKLSQINFLISSEINSFTQNGFFNKSLTFNPYFYSGYEVFLNYEIESGSRSKRALKKIIVGNSGHAVNNHYDALDFLSKNTVNIEILLPISYGYQYYISDLKKFALDKFGNRALFLEQFLPIKNLVDIFSKSDGLVMYAEVQSGLFAIYACLYLGKPVFLKKGSRLDLFLKELNLHFYYLEDLTDNFDSDNKLLQRNREIISSLLNSKFSLLSWRSFFSR